MIDRAQLENFLRVNGISTDSADGEIKSVLLAAKWNTDDVDSAITVLREDPVTKAQHIESSNKLFHSNEKLRPESLASLLGVSIDLMPDDMAMVHENRKPKTTSIDIIVMVGLGIILGLAALLATMFFMEVGPFHVSVALQQ